MPSLGECVDATPFPSYTWEDWADDTRDIIYHDLRYSVRRFNHSWYWVRKCTDQFIDWTTNLSAVILTALYLYHNVHIQFLKLGPLLLNLEPLDSIAIGVLLASLSIRMTQLIITAYITSHPLYYDNFLFDAKKWRLVRLAMRVDILIPTRLACDDLVDQAVRERVAELGGQQLELDDVIALTQHVHSRVHTIWSRVYLRINAPP